MITTMSGDELAQDESEPAIPSRERLRTRQTDDDDDDEEIENGRYADDSNIAKSRDDSKDERAQPLNEINKTSLSLNQLIKSLSLSKGKKCKISQRC